jgi:hypothetical protein
MRYRFSGYNLPTIILDETGHSYYVVKPHPQNATPMEDTYINIAISDGTRVEVRETFPSGEIPLALFI